MKKYELAEGTRIPQPINGIQVNFCKNPACKNFGVHASNQKQPRGRYSQNKVRDTYKVASSKKKELGLNAPTLECKLCGERPPLKSNVGINEEVERMLDYLEEKPIGCPNTSCSNHRIDRNAGGIYYSSFGKTKSGSQRYLCKLCRTTFSIGH